MFAPDSVIWQRTSDIRLFGAAGYALLLQVAHPTVGAGVRQFSSYQGDPWSRLSRTAHFLLTMIYRGPEASAAFARRLREMHKDIKGTLPDGRRYHALEPEAFAWVHATLVDAIVQGNARFGVAMSPDERARFYEDFRRLGLSYGVRERDLPTSWDGFREYFDEMVRTRLENTDAVQDLIGTSYRGTPSPGLPGFVWRIVGGPFGRAMRVSGLALLPLPLRERFGVRWTERHERAARRIASVMRAATPLMPNALRVSGPHTLRLLDRFGDDRLRFGQTAPALRP